MHGKQSRQSFGTTCMGWRSMSGAARLPHSRWRLLHGRTPARADIEHCRICKSPAPESGRIQAKSSGSGWVRRSRPRVGCPRNAICSAPRIPYFLRRSSRRHHSLRASCRPTRDRIEGRHPAKTCAAAAACHIRRCKQGILISEKNATRLAG
jgi:hypothetical protein